MPELALSNTTTFFSGQIETVFKKAKELGFKYLEIIPYRWSRPAQILALEKKYAVTVAGIHVPQWWKKPQLSIFTPLWAFYLGSARNSPALALAKELKNLGRDFYLLFHTDVARDAGQEFQTIASQFHVVLENIPGEAAHNPISAFDPNHFFYTQKKHPELDLIQSYQQLKPEVIHIGYDHFPMLHALPDKKQEEELAQMIAIHPPKYLVLETNPWVNVKRGKEILEKLMEDSETLRPFDRLRV